MARSAASPDVRSVSTGEFFLVGALALAGALAIKAPTLAGLTFEGDFGFYLRNASWFALAPAIAYLAWKRGAPRRATLVAASLVAASAVAANAYPFELLGQTEVLTALHLPLLLWLAVGITHAGSVTRNHDARMAFFRFSGEWLTYMSIFAAGGVLLGGLTLGSFEFVDIDASAFVTEWLLPCGAAGAPVVAAFLVQTQREGVAAITRPIAQVLVSLFAVMMMAIGAVTVWPQTEVSLDRDAMFGVVALLVFILALLIYSVAARGPSKRVHFIDRVQFTLIVCAWVMATLVGATVLARIAEWGWTPNRVAILGVSGILVANYFWTSWIGHVMLHLNCPFSRLDRWQTWFVWVYAGWAAFVVIALPPMFSYA